jgi:hypothetical protein
LQQAVDTAKTQAPDVEQGLRDAVNSAQALLDKAKQDLTNFDSNKANKVGCNESYNWKEPLVLTCSAKYSDLARAALTEIVSQ